MSFCDRIDIRNVPAHLVVMLKTVARHLLLIAVIFGLAGQGVARASTPGSRTPMARDDDGIWRTAGTDEELGRLR